MFSIEDYVSRLTGLLKQNFGPRLIYVGLQGSYLRGEAADSSDIDIMVVLDTLDVADLELYRGIVRSLERADLSCGFICGKDDLANWNPLEIWQLVNGTGDRFGALSELVPPCSREDIRNYAKMSLNNLYHELCHRYIHGKHENTLAALPALYKGTFFVLQNLYYLAHGNYIPTKAQLLSLLDGKDRAVLARSMELAQGHPVDFDADFALMFEWCRDTIQGI